MEWHPAYREQTWLLDWLDGKLFGGGPSVNVPLGRRPRLVLHEPSLDELLAEQPDRITLQRQKAHGKAPYVGRPFVYVWHCATDNLGRGIAGESKIVYTDDGFFHDDPYAVPEVT
jgi:hypothetical protein